MIVLWDPQTHCLLWGPSRLKKALAVGGLGQASPPRTALPLPREGGSMLYPGLNTSVGHQRRRHQGGPTHVECSLGMKPRPQWSFGRWSLATLLNLFLAWHRGLS